MSVYMFVCPQLETSLLDGLETSGRRGYHYYWVVERQQQQNSECFKDFLCVAIFFGFRVFVNHPTVKATVTNPKGSVEKLSPQEVSRMLTLSFGAAPLRTV